MALVWQLGVLLYYVNFSDQHPFLSTVNSNLNATNTLQNYETHEETVRSAGFITQTRRNILLIRYKKATGNDLKSHKLQQLFDKVFCTRVTRCSLDQFNKKISGNKLSLGLAKPVQRASNKQKGARAAPLMDDADDFMDFNPQVQILHQSGSSDENRGARNPQN